MTIWKKAVSVGTTAALLASLLVAVAAPAALASITQTSAGNVAQGSTSAGTATFLFTENSAAALTTTGHMYVTITPAAPGAGTVTWAGTPVVSAPDSLGVIVTFSALNVLDIRIRGFDNTNVETISITGLKVKASADASPGAVVATLSDDGAGAVYGAFVGGTTTAYGHLAQAYGIGSTDFVVALDTGSCPFDPAGSASVTVGSESVTWGTITADSPAIGQYSFTNPLDAFTVNHLANEVVTQTSVPACNTTALGAPATVVTAAAVDYDGPYTVYPGEANSPAGDIYVTEPFYGTATPLDGAGFLAKSSTLTYTIATDGVVFSGTPSVSDDDITMTLSGPILSSDRKSVVVTVTAASGSAAEVTLYNIRYDVASTVAGGTFIDVNVALSGGKLITGNPAENAVVFRGINATAPTPTVYIGENNQATGLVTLTEQDAGFFQSGTGANNVLAVCTAAVDYSFTFAPWAKVTAGDLRLREGDVSSPDNIVQGTWDGSNCYTWTVWTGSTTASTIVIGNADFSTGPLINVDPDQAPGIVAMRIYSGNGTSYTSGQLATVPFAVAAFRNQVAVTALSQPTIPVGAKSKAGAIQIAETANGQLKRWEAICVEIVPRTSFGFIQAKYDTVIQALNTAELPTVTATGGLVISPVEMSDEDCYGQQVDGPSIGPGMGIGTFSLSFSFDVLQQSTAGNGTLVIDNINLLTLADAANGPVLMNVYGFGGSPTDVEFQAQVSNAKIGVKSAIKINAVSALGLIPNQGPWSISTKVAAANKFITWKFDGGAALAGKTVRIYVATKNSSGGWGPFVNLTGRIANASGVAEFHWRATGTWVSVRAYYAGDATYAPSWSSPRQGRWLS